MKMEQLDKALARQQQKLNPNILNPVEVHSIEDIKRLVAQLDPSANPRHSMVPIGATLTAQDNSGKSQTYSVSAPTRSKNKREMLIEGFDIIKTRIEAEQTTNTLEVEVNGVAMKTPTLGTSSRSRTWIDPLIAQWLGGYRDGIYICWNLNDGFIYKYNIYEHKLTRTES